MNNIVNSNDLLSIDLKKDQMADIIINFLGKKEKLKYLGAKYFTLRLNDIEQFYYLIEEKIKKEQYVNIQLFTVSFLFNDNTTRTINTIRSLNKYTETRDVIPITVTLTWHVILQFPEVNTVETQKIELTFNTLSYAEGIFLNIEHTNQSWDIEILNLIKDKILSVSSSAPKNVKRMKYIKDDVFDCDNGSRMLLLITVLTISIVMMFSIFESTSLKINYNSKEIFEEYKNKKISRNDFSDYIYIMNNFDKKMQLVMIEKHMNKSHLQSSVLNKITNIIKEKEIKKKSLYKNMTITVGSLTLSIFLLYFYMIRYIEYYSIKSYILTTNRSTLTYEKDLKIKNKVEFYSINLIIFTLITGVIVNFIYSYIINS